MNAIPSLAIGLGTAASLLAGAALLSSCGVTPLNLENPDDVARLYRRKCGSCHAVINPSEYRADEWPLWLDEFGPDAHLTDHERTYLEPWLMARASDGPLSPKRK